MCDNRQKLYLQFTRSVDPLITATILSVMHVLLILALYKSFLIDQWFRNVYIGYYIIVSIIKFLQKKLIMKGTDVMYSYVIVKQGGGACRVELKINNYAISGRTWEGRGKGVGGGKERGGRRLDMFKLNHNKHHHEIRNSSYKIDVPLNFNGVQVYIFLWKVNYKNDVIDCKCEKKHIPFIILKKANNITMTK